MAIDYVLGGGCEPQERLGVERLVQLNRTRILARTAIAQMRDDGDQRAPKEIEIQLTMRTQTGDSGRGVTLQDLLDESDGLDIVAEYCKQCPADLPREFACHRRIRYPIPENVGCTAGAMLVRALGELGWDGAPTAKLRAAGDTFFESRVAHGVRWESKDGSIEISSDQLVQMLFLVGPVTPTHGLMMALFCGVIPHDTSLHDLKDEPGRRRVLAQAHVPTEPDPEIEQLAAFLRALAVAARLELPILIDG